MNLVVFGSTELVAVARALRAVAETNDSFTDGEADFIAAIAAMHGVVLDPRALERITPDALAQAVRDPFKRKRALQLLTVMALVEGEATLESDKALRQFGNALEVDEKGLDVVREVAKEQILFARFDMVRRMRKTLFRDQTLASLKSVATAALFGEDHTTAEKYRALARYPEGSLGRVLYDSWREHGFPIPGEKNGLPERGIFHDIGHILSGYGVDCTVCLAIRRLVKQAQKKQRDEGTTTCTGCGRTDPKGRALCRDCTAKERAARESAAKRGLCTWLCGKKAMDGRTICEAHWLSQQPKPKRQPPLLPWLPKPPPRRPVEPLSIKRLRKRLVSEAAKASSPARGSTADKRADVQRPPRRPSRKRSP